MATLVRTRLTRLSPAHLDELFRNSFAGPIPAGDTRGTALIAPGTRLAAPLARLVRLIAWQGKVFDPATGTLRNKISPFGIRAIVAKVYADRSWLDGQPCIVLDYSRTSLLAHWVRDEIREVAPGRYLGLVFLGRVKLIHFALAWPKRAR